MARVTRNIFKMFWARGAWSRNISGIRTTVFVGS
jgi:hypothetical protein